VAGRSFALHLGLAVASLALLAFGVWRKIFHSLLADGLFKEGLIYEQSATRTLREQQERRSCHRARQRLKIEQLRRLDSYTHILKPMSDLMRELRRRVSADRPPPPFNPCLPRPVDAPPAGPGWIHEIKHDGFCILAHRQGQAIRLMSRNGDDLGSRLPQIVEAMQSLAVKSCVIDGEAIVTNDKGLAVFDLIRGHRHHVGAELCAFDMLELDGEDLRRVRIEERKRTLARLLGRFQPGIVVNEYFEGDGAIIYEHVCALDCEGIVSKRLGTPYRAGRSAHWLKVKNPDAPAVRRLEEEDWS
jgi:bifunctional non-homologous end joining protein LigD